MGIGQARPAPEYAKERERTLEQGVCGLNTSCLPTCLSLSACPVVLHVFHFYSLLACIHGRIHINSQLLTLLWFSFYYIFFNLMVNVLEFSGRLNPVPTAHLHKFLNILSRDSTPTKKYQEIPRNTKKRTPTKKYQTTFLQSNSKEGNIRRVFVYRSRTKHVFL